ncbi:hypothetical protein B0581_005051 [Salmonella enterica subsp. enterica serovar Typhi]|nr:hypothetical protein [Salmonella enterica subsp. enterica serovar Typhi]
MISGAFVFQSLTLHPTANPVEPSRKPDPFTITPVVRPPLKHPQTLSDAKNTKRQGNTRLNQKNASESFSERCITMHESDARSISTVPKGEQVKMTSFLPPDGRFCTGILDPIFSHGIFVILQKKRVRISLTRFVLVK